MRFAIFVCWLTLASGLAAQSSSAESPRSQLRPVPDGPEAVRPIEEAQLASHSSCADRTPKWGLSLSDIFPLGSGDRSLRNACIRPNDRRDWSLISSYGYETFRGVADNGWQNNGLYGGVNFGTRLGSFSDRTGIGFQSGATLGLYDWKGNPYRTNAGGTMRQDFVSYGLFKRPTEESPFTLAMTQDWMIARNSGRYATSFALSQLRYRAGYTTSASNEFGVIGAIRLNEDRSTTATRTVATRPVSHMSAYWNHKWSEGGAETIITIGLPEKDRVRASGSLGDFLATATVKFPFSDTTGFFGNIMYMNPSAAAGFDGAHEEAWSFLLGIELFPGKDARTSTIAGERWMPVLPVANNGVFVLDAAAWP